jgi:hypothetical protein
MQQVMLMQLQRQTHLLRVLVLRQWLRLRHLLTSMTLQCRHCWHNWEQNQLTNSWGLVLSTQEGVVMVHPRGNW